MACGKIRGVGGYVAQHHFPDHAPAKIISITELENITRKRTHSGDKSRSKCFLFYVIEIYVRRVGEW